MRERLKVKFDASKFSKIISIGVDPGTENCGVVMFDGESLISSAKLNTYSALQNVKNSINEMIEQRAAIALAVENPFTNTGYTKTARGGRKYHPEKAQGAGYVKALFRIWEQMADSYTGCKNVFFIPVSIKTTHATGQIIRLDSLLKTKGIAIKSIHVREAAICALYGYEFLTKTNIKF